MRGEIIGFVIIKQITKPRLCSVLLERGRALWKCVSCFPPHFFRAPPPLPACFTTEQSTDEASLFGKENVENNLSSSIWLIYLCLDSRCKGTFRLLVANCTRFINRKHSHKKSLQSWPNHKPKIQLHSLYIFKAIKLQRFVKPKKVSQC